MIDVAYTGTEPVQYRIDCTHDVIYLTLRGDVSICDIAKAQTAILDDEHYRPGMSIYVDCRILTSVPSHDQIRKLAFERIVRAATIRPGKVAIVAMTRLGFALATAFEDFLARSAVEVSVFTSHVAARTWLGLA
jgi:hypothetical protein